MSHFSKDLLDAAPETLAALREILHGTSNRQGGRPVAAPSNGEGRFVGGNAGRAVPVRKRGSTSRIRA